MRKTKQAVPATTADVVDEVAVKAEPVEPVDLSKTDDMLDKIEAALEDADTTGPIESDIGSVDDLGDLDPHPLDALFDSGFMDAALEFMGLGPLSEEQINGCDTCPCGLSMALCHRNKGEGIRPARFGGMNIVLIN